MTAVTVLVAVMQTAASDYMAIDLQGIAAALAVEDDPVPNGSAIVRAQGLVRP